MVHIYIHNQKKTALSLGGIIALAVYKDTHPQAVSNRCIKKPLN
tara:strand:- start:2411 stop:2542 length:132 start_codon:yes stop_codon:yes gene_type:complete